MPRVCDRGCGRLACVRGQICCVRCPASHTRSCNDRERTRKATAGRNEETRTETADQRSPGPASQPSRSVEANNDADEVARVRGDMVQDLLAIIADQERKIQELTHALAVKDAAIAGMLRERESLRRFEPAPEPW